MYMEEHSTHNPSSNSTNKGIWYVLAVVLLLLFVFGLASNKKKEPEITSTSPGVTTPPVQQRVKTGSSAFMLNPGNQQLEPQTTFAVGTVKPVAVTMNTEGRQVVGYNLIIQYDPNQMKIGKIVSTIPQFTAYQNEATPGYIVIDGVKTSTDDTPVVLTNQQLLTVPVTVKSEGVYTLRLIEKNNKDEAKFFDENMTPYYPKGAVVTIQSN